MKTIISKKSTTYEFDIIIVFRKALKDSCENIVVDIVWELS